jgi:hypothetical protein
MLSMYTFCPGLAFWNISFMSPLTAATLGNFSMGVPPTIMVTLYSTTSNFRSNSKSIHLGDHTSCGGQFGAS